MIPLPSPRSAIPARRWLVAAIALAVLVMMQPGAIGPGSPAYAQTPAEAGDFSMIFASDPQLPWWRGGGDSDCTSDECVKQKGIDTNEDFVSAMNSITSLGNWPATGLDRAAGAPVTSPDGVILNGDLTAYWHKWQKELFDGAFGNLTFQLYPGLGNHDYQNNAHALDEDQGCVYDPIYWPDQNRCAKEAVWWMANQIDNLPNLVRHDAPGFVAVENAGAYNIRFEVKYFLNGAEQSQQTDDYEAGQWRTLTIPAGATNVRYWIDGLITISDPPFLGWRTLQSGSLASPASSCFETTGTTFEAGANSQNCGGTAFPDGSSGSLAYSFEIGDYHFVQLQNWPGFSVNLPRETTAEEVLTFGLRTSPGFNVTPSYTWLTNDLAAATAAGKNIIINMHDDSYSGGGWSDASFRSAIADQNVVGIFAGHIHQTAGRIGTISNGLRNDIPVYRSGSAECGTFLYADFHERFYNVSVIDATGGSPSFLTDSSWTCDTGVFNGINYGFNSGSAGMIGTYDFNLAPAINSADASPDPADEGSEVNFSATATDGDDNVDSLTYSWDFGDGQTGSGDSTTHTYADNGTYTVQLTVEDPYGGSDTTSFNVTINNVAPTVTATGDSTDEHGVATVSGTITDPGTADSFTLTIDWGEGDPASYSYPAGTTSFSETHQYLDDDPSGTASDGYTVALTISDDDAGSGDTTATVTVNNVAPALTATGATIDENGTATVTGTITDPGTRDTFTLTIDWGEGAPVSYAYPAGATAFSESHQYLDDNPTGTPGDAYMVSSTIEDDDTGIGSTSAIVTVNNVEPVASFALSGQTGLPIEPGELIPTGAIVNLAGTFGDTGTRDSHTASTDWGDGTITTSTVDEAGGSGTAVDSHAYAAPGTYTITFTLTDDDTGTMVITKDITIVGPRDACMDVYSQLSRVQTADREASLRLRLARMMLGAWGYGATCNALDHDPYGYSLDSLARVTVLLELAEGDDRRLDFFEQKTALAILARSVAEREIEAAAADARTSRQMGRVDDAWAMFARGDTWLSQGDFSAAIDVYADAVWSLRWNRYGF